MWLFSLAWALAVVGLYRALSLHREGLTSGQTGLYLEVVTFFSDTRTQPRCCCPAMTVWCGDICWASEAAMVLQQGQMGSRQRHQLPDPKLKASEVEELKKMIRS